MFISLFFGSSLFLFANKNKKTKKKEIIEIACIQITTILLDLKNNSYLDISRKNVHLMVGTTCILRRVCWFLREIGIALIAPPFHPLLSLVDDIAVHILFLK